MDRNSTKDLMGMLCLLGTMDKLARINGVRRILRKNEDDVLRRVLDFKVNDDEEEEDQEKKREGRWKWKLGKLFLVNSTL